MSQESQCDKILWRLQHIGSITPVEAYHEFGCLALHSRVSELRLKGYDIEKVMRSANGKRWGEYFLGGKAEVSL